MDRPAEIGIVGGGPAGLVAAIALARRGIATTVFERDTHPLDAPRFDPDRSYTIDITGHGLRALRHIDATSYFDEHLLRFKGIQYHGKVVVDWSEPGWTGSRRDIVRALAAVIADRHQDAVEFRFFTVVDAVDVTTGDVSWSSGRDGGTHRFALVIGADGAGSAVRAALQHQVAGFAVEQASIPNYVTMIELDRVRGRLDKNYLHALSLRHFFVGGAIGGDEGADEPRWFCAIGGNEERRFASTEEARAFFRKTCPEVLDYASDEALAAFAERPCYHVGRTLTCSQLHAGRVVLIGDAGAPFPPIGQGVNAAMESAMILDHCIGEHGDDLLQAAAVYDAAWKPETEAVSWISQKVVFEKPLNTLRSVVTMAVGQNPVDQAKSSKTSYSEVRRQAERLGPLWT